MNDALTRPDHQLAEEWMFPVFLLSLVILAFLNYSSPARLRHTWKSVFSPRYMRQVIREESNVPKEYFLLVLNFILLTSLLLYGFFKIKAISFFGLSEFALYASLCGSLLLLYPAKTFLISVVSWVINGDFGLAEYRYWIILLNRFVGILLLPVVLLAMYLPIHHAATVVFTGLFLLGAVYLYRLSMALINALRSDIGVFYIFFYICTLEILPLVVFTKLILLQFPIG